MTTFPMTPTVDVDRILDDLAAAKEHFNTAVERGESEATLRHFASQLEQAENTLVAARDAGFF